MIKQFCILINRIYNSKMKTLILLYLVGLVLGQGCPPEEYSCPVSGDCISQDRLCDGTVDCSHAEDESPSTCPCDGYRCPYLEYMCIPEEKICDGIADCLAAEEEQWCGCWFCDTGECFSEDEVCDGYRDCPGGEDEKDCPCDDKYRCEDGMCIPEDWVCDATNDCLNGDDEQSCEGTCKGFLCANNRCVSSQRLCDGQNDCLDWSDEAEQTCPCADNELRCGKAPGSDAPGACIPPEQVCDEDGIWDCPDGSDEANCTKPIKDHRIRTRYHRPGKAGTNQIRKSSKISKHSPKEARKQRVVKSKRGSRHPLQFLLKKSKKQ